MFIHDVSDSDFIKVLGALPSTPAVTRAHILGAFDVIVNSDDQREWWYRRTLDRDERRGTIPSSRPTWGTWSRAVYPQTRCEASWWHPAFPRRCSTRRRSNPGSPFFGLTGYHRKPLSSQLRGVGLFAFRDRTLRPAPARAADLSLYAPAEPLFARSVRPGTRTASCRTHSRTWWLRQR